MRAPVASLWMACLWLGGSGTSVALGDEPDCVTACIESAIDSFNRCRELGGTVSECLETVEREFTQCSGERGCQKACADGCLAETSSVYASCLGDDGS